MNYRWLLAVAGISATCGALLYHTVSWAADDKNAQQESTPLRYARVKLKIAEVAMQKAKDMNRRVPGTIPSDLVAQYADDVEIAKLQLEVVQKTGHISPLQEWIWRAELALRGAEVAYKNAAGANRTTPGTFTQVDVERLRLNVELAQMHVEYGKSLMNASPDAKLSWIVEMMNEDLARLKKKAWLLFQDRGPSDI